MSVNTFRYDRVWKLDNFDKDTTFIEYVDITCDERDKLDIKRRVNSVKVWNCPSVVHLNCKYATLIFKQDEMPDKIFVSGVEHLTVNGVCDVEVSNVEHVNIRIWSDVFPQKTGIITGCDDVKYLFDMLKSPPPSGVNVVLCKSEFSNPDLTAKFLRGEMSVKEALIERHQSSGNYELYNVSRFISKARSDLSLMRFWWSLDTTDFNMEQEADSDDEEESLVNLNIEGLPEFPLIVLLRARQILQTEESFQDWLDNLKFMITDSMCRDAVTVNSVASLYFFDDQIKPYSLWRAGEFRNAVAFARKEKISIVDELNRRGINLDEAVYLSVR